MIFLLLIRLPPCSTLFPYTTLFRSLSSAAIPVAPTSRSKFSSAAFAIPIYTRRAANGAAQSIPACPGTQGYFVRSEEHTSELQSHVNLVCRLLLEKKKNKLKQQTH